jgi:hypothetical protein
MVADGFDNCPIPAFPTSMAGLRSDFQRRCPACAALVVSPARRLSLPALKCLEATISMPSPMARKARFAQRHAEFAGVTVPAPAAPQLNLKRGEGETFDLQLVGHGRQHPHQPLFDWREALARGLDVGAYLSARCASLKTVAFNSFR